MLKIDKPGVYFLLFQYETSTFFTQITISRLFISKVNSSFDRKQSVKFVMSLLLGFLRY